MPFLAPLAAAAASLWTAAGAITFAGISLTSVIGFVATTALSYGLNAYEKAAAKRKARKQAALATASNFGQDIQQIIRQATAPRFRSYGTVKVGGIMSFYEARNGAMFLMTITGQGTIAGIDEFWINDKQVLLDADQNVITAPFLVSNAPVMKFEWRRGLIDQPSSALLQAAFPEWTSLHQLKGLAWTLLRASQVEQSLFQTVYNSQVPSFRQVHRAALVWDPRDSSQVLTDPNTWKWSSNPVVVALDYFTHSDGMALNRALFDLDSFKAAMDRCDELVPLADGGSERRYTCSGTYNLEDEPKTVIDGILDSCRGEVRLLPSGLIGVNIGYYDPEPQFTVIEDHILSFEVSKGGTVMSEFNSVKAKYTSPLHDYQEMEAETLKNADAIAIFGRELPEDYPLPWVTSFTQARRLSKIELYEDNPEWSGTLTLNAFGLNLLAEWLFRLQLPELGIDMVCRNRGVTLGDDLTTVKVEFATLNPKAYEWSTAEEGTPPPIPAATGDNAAMVPPTGMRVVTGVRGTVMYGGLTWNKPTDTTLSTDVRWRQVGADWKTTNIPAGTNWYEFSPLTAGANYEINARRVDTTGNVTTWSVFTFVATDDQTAPSPPSALQVAGQAEKATIAVINSEAPQAWAVEIVSSIQGASSPGYATPALRLVGAPAANLTGTVTQPSGDRSYYARAVSIAGVPSTEIGPVNTTIPAPAPPSGGSSGDGGNTGGGTGNQGNGGWGGGLVYGGNDGGGGGGQVDNSGDVGNNTPGGYW